MRLVRPVCYNCGMAKGDGFPDPVSEAFRRVSQEAQARREAGAPHDHQPIDWVTVALGVLVLALIRLGRPDSVRGLDFPRLMGRTPLAR